MRKFNDEICLSEDHFGFQVKVGDDMVIKVLHFLFLLMFSCISLFAQNNGNEIERIADDARFGNAYYLVTIGRKDKAITLLSEYIEVYIDGAHRKKAILTIGDIYYERFEYLRASNFYMMLFEEYPDSEEGVEAYYRTGLCSIKMGDRDKAASVFQDIVENYQGFAASEKAGLEYTINTLIEE